MSGLLALLQRLAAHKLPMGRRMYGWHTARRVMIATLLSLAVAAGPAAQAPRPEVAIKSEFVLRFPEFVEWPAPGNDRRPLSLCLSPSHPFGQTVQTSASGLARAKQITVRELRDH